MSTCEPKEMCHSFINFLFGSGTIACVLCSQMNLGTENCCFFLCSCFPFNSTLPTAISFQVIRGVYFKANWSITYSVVFEVKTKLLYKEVNNSIKEQRSAAVVS